MIPAARRLERATRRALVQKERRESRAALVAGLVIFLGLPILWTVLYAVVDTRHEVLPGFAATLFAAGGGLYAAVIAAQSVCRDFGRAPGEFLLARPVTILEVLRAKAAVGFRLIGGLALAVLALETTLAAGTKLPQDFADVIHLWLISTGINMLAYWSAFAAAAITRRTLSGVLVAGLFLALLAAIPLTSSASTDFAAWIADAAKYPLYWTYGVVLGITDHSAADPHLAATLGLPFSFSWAERRWFGGSVSMPATIVVAGLLVVVAGIFRYLFTLLFVRRRLQQRASTVSIAIMLLFLGVSAVSLQTRNLLSLGVLLAVVLAASLGRGAAVIACRSQRALRLSTKSLAWTIGLSVVTVFTLAMSEVGANKNIASTYWDPTGAFQSDRPGAWNKFAVGKHRIALGSRGSSVRLFDVSGDGQISLRAVLDPVLSEAEAIDSHGPIPVFDERDELFIISNANTWGDLPLERFWQSREPIPAFRVELRHVSWEDGTLGPRTDISMPMLIPHEHAGAYDAAIDGEHLYVLYEFVPPRSRLASSRMGHVALAVFQLNEQRNLKVLRVSNLGIGGRYGPRQYGYHFSRGADRRLYAVTSFGRPLDPAHPSSIPWNAKTVTTGVSGFYFAAFMIGEAFACGGDFGGFSTYAPPRPRALGFRAYRSRGVTIGGVKASPWAMLFRSGYPILEHAGPGQVWEAHGGSVICYDVSDPYRPRRIAHVTSHHIRDAVSGPDFLLLDHGPGFSIVRHPQTSR